MTTESEEKVEETEEKASRKSAERAKAAHDDHDAHGGHDHGGAAVPYHSHRSRYLKVFGALIVLTGLELGVVYVGLARNTVIAMLILLAVTKAGAVALFFMHLADERRVLRLMIGLPLLFPPFYAVVLIIEAIARASFMAKLLG